MQSSLILSGREKPSGKSALLAERGRTVNALTAADSISVSRAEMRWVASETHRMLDGLSRDVRECKNVMLASLYARWVQFSGLMVLLERGTGDKTVQKKVEDLLYECGELFRGGKHDPKYAASDIAEINRKLDMLLGCARPAVQDAVALEIEKGRADSELVLALPPSSSK